MPLKDLFIKRPAIKIKRKLPKPPAIKTPSKVASPNKVNQTGERIHYSEGKSYKYTGNTPTKPNATYNAARGDKVKAPTQVQKIGTKERVNASPRAAARQLNKEGLRHTSLMTGQGKSSVASKVANFTQQARALGARNQQRLYQANFLNSGGTPTTESALSPTPARATSPVGANSLGLLAPQIMSPAPAPSYAPPMYGSSPALNSNSTTPQPDTKTVTPNAPHSHSSYRH